jgi:predicted nucleotidyltransferase
MQLSQTQIESIRHFFKDKPVVRAYLFGSYVRGEASEGSDIDILVDLDYTKSVGMEFIEMALDLEDMFEQKVDLISSRGVSKYIAPYIEKEKKLIYERISG